MRVAIVLFALAGVAVGAPTQVQAAPVVVAAQAPIVASAVSAQHHAQDELGQYNYGYTNPLSAKEETKTVDGITRGGYSYLDAHGLVQSVNYVSDDVNGFRVAATNLPAGPVEPVRDEPVVANAKALHAAAAANEVLRPIVVAPAPETLVVEQTPVVETRPIVVAETGPAIVAPASPVLPPAITSDSVAVPVKEPAVIVAPAPPAHVQAPPTLVSAPVVQNAPLVVSAPAVQAAPAVVSAPVVQTPPAVVPAPVAPVQAVVSAPVIASAVSAQHHAQDELGQYSYGYVNPLSAKEEIKTADGITRGGYSYLDSHGLVQNVNYVSDDVNGFRVAASNIPQQVKPVEIPDSPEVAAAKAKFFTAIAQAKAAVEH